MEMPLIEKYIPTELSQIIGIDVDKISTIIDNPKSMPNLLFYGPQGTGKTSLAKVIIKKLDPIDYIKINGSDKTGVDTVRDKVYNFISAMSSEPDKPKIVWIEEFDYMSQNAFAALRAMIEQHLKNARFICTCNYLNKIPDAIISRFTPVEFKKPDAVESLARMVEICAAEKISVSEKALLAIAEANNGDIRATLNDIQQLSSNIDKTILDDFILSRKTTLDKVYGFIINKEWSKIRYEILSENPDYNQIIVDLDETFFKSELPTDKKIEINDILAKGMYEMSFSFDKSICFSAIASRIMKVL